MRSIQDIREEIERASERRAELYSALSRGRDDTLAAELRVVHRRLEDLWEEQRAARAEVRFGPRESIRRRARTEERLERAA
jgi:hypothetical protein